MTQQVGSRALIGVGEETVAVGTASLIGFIIPVNSTTVSKMFTRNSPATLTGNRNPVKPYKGNTDVTGDIVVPLDDEALWYWLQLAFGDPTTSGAGDPYTHVFKIGNTQPSFTHEKGFTDLATDKYFVATGCKVARLSLEFGGDGELTMTLGVVGMNETIETSTAFSGTSTTVALDEVYDHADAAITEGGGASTIIKSFSINVDFGLDTTQRVIGAGGVLGSIPEGIVAVTGNIKTIFEDTVILEKGLNSTETALVLSLTSTVTASHILSFDIGELLYSYKSPEVTGPQGLEVDLDFAAYYDDDSDASALMVTNINASAHA